MQIKIFSSRFFLIVIFSFLFFFLFFIKAYASQNKGQIISITPDGYIYINLGLDDRISEGDLIEIYDGGKKILTLQVEDVFQKVSKLHPPKRKDLPKLRVGLQVIPYLKEISITAIEGKIIAFDLVQESGFIDLGSISGIEEGMEFEVLKEGDVVAIVKVIEVYNKISKVVLIKKGPEIIILTGLKVRLKVEKIPKEKAPIGLKTFMPIFRDKFSGEIRSIVTNYTVVGNKGQSFYPPLLTAYREEVDLKYKDSERDTNLEAFGGLRLTDDGYVDTENVSIENLYFDSKGKHLNLRIGDFLSNFTNYSLSRSLKGIKASLIDNNLFGTLNALAIFGTTKSRWEYFWERIPNSNYAQYVTGFRIAQDFSKNHTLGFNFVNTEDDKDSSEASNVITKKNRVFSIDFKSKPLKGLKIDTEWATSLKRYEIEPTEIECKNDYAFNIDVNIDADLPTGKWSFKNKYEIVGANFEALSGVSSVDREEIYSQIGFKYFDMLSGKVGYRYYHDNLKKRLTKTTNNYDYDAYVTYRPFEKWLPDFDLNYEFDMRTHTSGDSSVDDNITTHTFGIHNKTGVYNYGAEYSMVDKTDDITPSNDRKKDIFNADIKSNYKLGKIRLMPSISYELERDRQKTTGDLDLYQRLRLGANVYIGKDTSLRLYYTYSHIDYYIDGRDQIKHLIDVSFRTYLFNTRENILELSFKQNDFNREGQPDTSFTENLFECRYTFRF